MNIKSFALAIVSACVMLLSCKSTKGVEGVWRSMNMEEKLDYNHFALFSMDGANDMSKEKENILTKLLKENGKKSFSLSPFVSNEDLNLNKQALLKEMQDKSADVVLTIIEIPEGNTTQFNKSIGSYSPIKKFGWYGSIWGYYTHWFTRKAELEKEISGKSYYEINLYDVKSESLIWSAQSKLFEQAHSEEAFHDFANKAIKQMRKDGFLYDSVE